MNTQVQTISMGDDEVNAIEKFLRRAADTIVDASTLRSEVTQLSREVEELREQVRTMREANAFLDESLTRTRQERDEANQKVVSLQLDNDQLRRTVDDISNIRDILQDRVNVVTDRNEVLVRERDEAITHGLVLEEKVRKLETQLAETARTMKAQLESVANILGFKQPEPSVPTLESPQYPSAVNY